MNQFLKNCWTCSHDGEQVFVLFWRIANITLIEQLSSFLFSQFSTFFFNTRLLMRQTTIFDLKNLLGLSNFVLGLHEKEKKIKGFQMQHERWFQNKVTVPIIHFFKNAIALLCILYLCCSNTIFVVLVYKTLSTKRNGLIYLYLSSLRPCCCCLPTIDNDGSKNRLQYICTCLRSLDINYKT